MKNDANCFKVIAKNKRAHFDYLIEETIEVGLILLGSEVKSLRQSNATIAEAYAGEMQGEIQLINATIPEYKFAHHQNHAPKRPRILLLHKKQKKRLIGLIKQERVTLVPQTLYFNHKGLVKLSIGVGKGKNKADKRLSEKEKDWKRQQSRLLRNRDIE